MNFPGYISTSAAGSYDNEGVAIFALVFTYYLWIKQSSLDQSTEQLGRPSLTSTMPGTKIHIHSSSSTYKLEVSSFEELLREISRIEHANSDSIQIKHDNKVLDEQCDFSSLENAHVDVSVSMIGPGMHIDI